MRAENEIAGAPTGGMDQAASLRSQDGHALLLDCLDGSVRHVPFDLAAHDLALLVVDTRAEHALVDGQYAARRASCEAAAARLGVATLREVSDDPRGLEWALDKLDDEVQVRRVRHVVNEIDRVTWFVALLDAGEVGLVGTLMNASHASLRDDYEVSCRELDLVVDTARAAGAARGADDRRRVRRVGDRPGRRRRGRPGGAGGRRRVRGAGSAGSGVPRGDGAVRPPDGAADGTATASSPRSGFGASRGCDPRSRVGPTISSARTRRGSTASARRTVVSGAR